MRCSRLAFPLGLFLVTGALVVLESSSSRSAAAAEAGPTVPPYAEANDSGNDWYYSGRWYDEYHGYPIHDAYGYDYRPDEQAHREVAIQTESGHSYQYDCDYDYEYDYWQDKYTRSENQAADDQILEADANDHEEATDVNHGEEQTARDASVNTPDDQADGYDEYNYGKYGYDYYGYVQDESQSYTDPQIDSSEPVTEPEPVAELVAEPVAEQVEDLTDTRYDDGYHDGDHEGHEYDAYLADEYDYARSYAPESAPSEPVTETVTEQTDDLTDTRHGDGYYDQYGHDPYLDDKYDYSEGYGKYGDDYTYRNDSEYDSDYDANAEYGREYEGYEDYESDNAYISDDDASDDHAAYDSEHEGYGENGEYDYFYCEHGYDYEDEAGIQRPTQQEVTDTESVMGEMRYMDDIDPFTWMPSDLLQPADKELLRTLNALFEEPGTVRELALDEYIESLGLDAAEFVARFEEAFGGRALALHDDLPGVAALLAAYRMVEQGEISMDGGVEILQRSFNSLSPEWIEDVSFIVTELPDNRGVRTERDLRDEDSRVLQAILAVSTRSVSSVGLGLSAVFSDLTTLPGRVLAVGDAARLSDFGTAALRNWTAR